MVHQYASGYWFSLLKTSGGVVMESLGNFKTREEAVKSCDYWLNDSVAKEIRDE